MFSLESHGGRKGGLLLEHLYSLGKLGPVEGVDPCGRRPLFCVPKAVPDPSEISGRIQNYNES